MDSLDKFDLPLNSAGSIERSSRFACHCAECPSSRSAGAWSGPIRLSLELEIGPSDESGQSDGHQQNTSSNFSAITPQVPSSSK